MRLVSGNFYHAASDDIAFFVLGEVFIQAGWNQLFHAQADEPLRRIEREHLRLDDLPGFQHFLRVIDALFRADFADVNHALHAFGKLHEGAELGQARDRPFDHRARRKFLFGRGPGIAQRLLQPERDAAFCRVHP